MTILFNNIIPTRYVRPIKSPKQRIRECGSITTGVENADKAADVPDFDGGRSTSGRFEMMIVLRRREDRDLARTGYPLFCSISRVEEGSMNQGPSSVQIYFLSTCSPVWTDPLELHPILLPEH